MSEGCATEAKPGIVSDLRRDALQTQGNMEVVMKKSLVLAALMAVSTSVFADTWVNGYMRSDGTYVQGHYRSNPNGTLLDNYSTKGNYNPYTGKMGTVDPYGSRSFGSSRSPFGSSSGSLYRRGGLYGR